jgi:ammonia channel protein AmtB
MSPEELRAVIDAAANASMEAYYWWATGIMICIHAGFMMYEMGQSRVRNVLASGVKNILALAFIIPTFFLFGWWLYWAYGTGNIFLPDAGAEFAQYYVPWSDGMGPNLQDQASGVFWAAFVLFSATTASIVSGSVIERIRISSWIILATLVGSVVWIIAAGWGWSAGGWLVVDWGYHDVGAAGVVHMISGFFALGVLINLGPRVGRFNADGSANDLPGHNVPMTIAGLMIIIIGFFGFLGACLIYPAPMAGSTADAGWLTIYGGPATLSSFAFNTLMGFAGGIIGAYFITKDPFWMMSGALAGIFCAAAGLDLWYPGTAFALGFLGGVVIPYSHKLVTSWGIDDAVGAVSVHGTCGLIGVLAVGVLLGGYPPLTEGGPTISFTGQLVGAIAMGLGGFIPGYVVSWILNKCGILRTSDAVQEIGVDTEIPVAAYPENMLSRDYS